MARWWIGGALVGVWLGVVSAAQAQFGPVPPAPSTEPVPFAPSGAGNGRVVVGPLTGRDVPPGPGESLALPDKIPNAFGGEECIDPDKSVEGGFRVSAGVMVLKPLFGQNPAFNTTTPKGAERTQQDFHYGMDAGPWVSVEWMDESGWGVRVHGWHLLTQATTETLTQTNSSPRIRSAGVLPGFILTSPGGVISTDQMPAIPGEAFQPFMPGSLSALGIPGDSLTFGAKTQIDVIDLEATRQLDFDSWAYLLSLGLRYASVAQNYRATRSHPPGNTVFLLKDTDLTDGPSEPEADPAFVNGDTSFLDYGRRFTGFGPTIMLEVDVPVGVWGLTVYGNVRGSLLIGAKKQDAFLQQEISGQILHDNAADADAPPFVSTPFHITNIARASTSGADVWPVGEAEVGLDWQSCGPRVSPFAQVGGVAQSWVGAGNNSSERGTMYLFGLRAAAGLQF